MKKIIILISFALLYASRLFAQVTSLEKDPYFYRQLIVELGVNKNIPIYYKTTLRTLKRVNIKDNSLKWSNKDTVEDVHTLLKQIGIESLKEDNLLKKIGTHPFTYKMHEFIKSQPQPFLALSPIVYSNDKKLALCAVYEWYDKEAASETVYLLSYRWDKWKIIKFLVVSIS